MTRFLLASLVGALIYAAWAAIDLSEVLPSSPVMEAGGLVTAVLAALAGLAIGAYHRRGLSNLPPGEMLRGDTQSTPPADSTKPSTSPVSTSSHVSKPGRSEAITLLATLQREARFVDLVQESLTEYSDAQVGAAARDVLRDCRTVLDRFFDLQPVVDQPEGTSVEMGVGQSAGRTRMTGADQTGSANEDSCNRGSLVHHGWEARQCHLPKWSGSQELALLVVPAELEKR